MFYKSDDDGYRQVLPGIDLKTLTFGKSTLFTEFRMKAGSCLPPHAHPHEQTGYLVQGKLVLKIGSEEFEVSPGDCWCIESNTEHAARILEDSVAVEIFSPVREEYLPQRSDDIG
jgi:quercetin dioxygenase-like cupin family protein